YLSSSRLQVRFDVVACEVVEAAGDERSPAGLMRCAEAAARLAVKVFVEEDEFAPVRIVGEACVVALPSRAALVVWDEDAREPAIQFLRDFGERQHATRSRRAFDLEIVAVEVMITLQRL